MTNANPLTVMSNRLNGFQRLPMHYQLSVATVFLVVFIALGFLLLALWSNQKYHDESTQRLHLGLAQYIVDHQYEPLIQQEQVNHKALHQIAMQVMAINPLVEVFLLDPKGNVLGHALPSEQVQLDSVSVGPILERLSEGSASSELIYGDNPRVPLERRLFSVAQLSNEDGVAVGYLYVVLNSLVVDSIVEQLQGSHIAKLIAIGVGGLVLLGLLVSILLLHRLTRPLRSLTAEMNAFQQSNWMAEDARPDLPMSINSELPLLDNSFQTMKQRIVSQFEHLQENNRLRRELISNVSHDLRTPLASLQGYIEALILKKQQLSEAKQQQYLATAHRNAVRLTRLVTELFELSKLEAGQVKPEIESFSLLELVYDIVQDYELAASEQNISLQIEAEKKSYVVAADIALIQRVLQNLIDNALRFTPNDGVIEIRLQEQHNKLQITVANTGFGIKNNDLPYIFDAYYSTRNNPDVEADKHMKQGTGLGLAIVKRVLELHDSSIKVLTTPGKGTQFRFELALN
ncbi:MAG: HAMP domain-containing histidine kinase [Gammaproteobacteria bacterium]|nr:HAMP domain-containing histidine kinase [Gammaproteobacteria bacterium]